MSNERQIVTCGFCGRAFNLEESRRECRGCSLLGLGGCRRICCPHCRYEMPAPARLPQAVRKLLAGEPAAVNECRRPPD